MANISLKHIAEELGVSRQTVSRALRGERYVRPELAERIRQAAERLGYQPDARFKVLNLMRRGNPARPGETMAMILPDSTLERASYYYFTQQVMEGAQLRAAETGFGFEVHSMVDQPDRKLLEGVLKARGIELLILAPLLQNVQPRLALAWHRYAAVLVGPGIWRPRLNRVSQNFYLNMILLLRKLKSLGYRRPVLIMERVVLQRALYAVEAAFRQNSALLGLENPGMYVWKGRREDNVADCRAWLKNVRADVIICDQQNDTFFREMGLAIPEDIGFVSLVCHPSIQRISGINVRADLLGAHAVDLLAGHYFRNERGLPRNPKMVLHEGVWNRGETIRTQDRSPG